MKTKNYALIAEGKHEYDITVQENENCTSYEMRYSQASHWSQGTRGEFILAATDTGNEICFNEKISKKMNYDTFLEMKLFMEFLMTYEGDIGPEFKTYEQITKNQK
jgi:hypothetical protein